MIIIAIIMMIMVIEGKVCFRFCHRVLCQKLIQFEFWNVSSKYLGFFGPL